ncbi:MAG TPA: heavy metal-associated domain-containing protein [Acholeplasma sp.]|nr:heavy metal-associated domain-containing protein [Acholeplasma sp.]
MKKTILQLETLTCPSCVKRIEGTLSKQTGVDKIEVKFNASKVEVHHNEDLVSIETLRGLVTKLGYKVLGVK